MATSFDPAGAGAITYAGQGDLHQAADAVEAASQRIGLACDRRKDGDDTLLIEATQQASPARIVLRGLPQVVEWRLEQQGRQLTISAELRLFRWYRYLLTGLFLVVAGTLLAAVGPTDAAWRSEYPRIDQILTFLLNPVILLAFAMVRLFGPLGGGGLVAALWQAALEPLEKAGSAFEPRGLAQTRRYLQTVLIGYFSFAWLVVVASFVLNPRRIFWFLPNGLLVLVFVPAAAATALFVALALNPTRRAFELRSDSALPGLISMSAVMIGLNVQTPWMILGFEITRGANLYFLTPREDYRFILEDLRILSAGLVAFSGVLGTVATVIVLSALQSAIQSRVGLRRLQTRRATPAHQRAVAGGRRLRRFRGAFVTIWLLLSIVILAGWAYALLGAVQAVHPSLPHPAVRPAELAAEALALLIQRPFADPGTHGIVRGAWLLYAATLSLALLASLGQLLRARHHDRRVLNEAQDSISPDPRRQELQTRLDELSICAGAGETRLAVLQEPRPYVGAQCFGLRGMERFVVVSEGTLQDFDDAELDVLFAHELVHLRQGHCRTAVLLRWLGRLTFAGDGFALALQNSFGYEQEADRIILDEALAPPQALERCLIKMQHSAAAWQGHRTGSPRRAMPPGIQKDLREASSGALLDLPLLRRTRLGWWLFRQQYFAAMDLHYWHPTYLERREAVVDWRHRHAS